MSPKDPLSLFHPPTRRWFADAFGAPTAAQAAAWPEIAAGRSTLLLAPTGSGKTLAAFLAAIDRLMFAPEPPPERRCRVIYVSPLKALAADVERNLQRPLAGIAAVAEAMGAEFRRPTIGVRSGDTTQAERGQLRRAPPDIYITTPESLYLLLTSSAREGLLAVESVIVDEIHAVAATKRGAHLFLTLERLEMLRRRHDPAAPPLQRIGLSATQRPLEEVARLLGGGATDAAGEWQPRPVTIAAPPGRKAWELTIEVPAEESAEGQAREGMSEGTGVKGHAPEGMSEGTSAKKGARSPARARRKAPGAGGLQGGGKSIWPSIVPRLVERIRAHRSTMIFCNNRRLAERLAAAINDHAQAEIALAHHGAVARDRRQIIEARLKAGELPAIVATSSLELGIDVGAVELVIQIESPPSVSAGIQRIGRAGHQVGAVSRGVLVPKFRGDLLACAAAAPRIAAGEVEPIAYPRSPLDVLAQQVVASVAMDATTVEALHAEVRGAAPFADLSRETLEGVLDMLSGRYPSDEFAELKPRITWDRDSGRLTARAGSRTLAVVSGGTIPDRGLYGVFLQGEPGATMRRVGELDEEMVFESRVGEVFLLGASSWRIEEITPDRVIVSPAPGQPGKMPFWRGDAAGRPAEFGRAIGRLARELASATPAAARRKLTREHFLDEKATDDLLDYVQAQRAATGEVPSDEAIVVERWRDDVGDWRVCVLSPFGARVHAPWATAALARLREQRGEQVEGLWSDDGMVFRFPDAEAAPDMSALLLAPEVIEDLVVQQLGQTAVFAARFRENAARALLLPRRFPGRRAPLWAQRKRAADLLSVAGRFGSFPIVLETFRECLREVFDLPALRELLRQVQTRELRVVTVDSERPSPFAGSLLFGYVGNFMYEGDAPLAERRAQALAIDTGQLRALLGESSLRELLDAEAIAEVERGLQRITRPATSADALHDLLIALGDLSRAEIAERCAPPDAAGEWLGELVAARRVFSIHDKMAEGTGRFAAVEDAGRLEGALGVALPKTIPQALRAAVADPLGDLVRRYARTHGPFTAAAVAARLSIGTGPIDHVLKNMAAEGRVVAGEFTPGGTGAEWCDAEVLRQIKRRSLARLRKAVEPAPQAAYARFLSRWQHLQPRLHGRDALLQVVGQLQGAPLLASALETEILPARLVDYRAGDLDGLCAAGEVGWLGVAAVGSSDGRIALYLADQLDMLRRPGSEVPGELPAKIRAALRERGALFFSDLAPLVGGFEPDLLQALWDMVWAGEVSNDTLVALRKLVFGSASDRRRGAPPPSPFRARRLGPPGSEGRWSLVWPPRHVLRDMPDGADSLNALETRRRHALAQALLERHGIVTREAVQAEEIAGGFSAVYEVLKAMEEAGRVRRGYFVDGLGAAQFAVPGAEDRLRALREPPAEAEAVVLASTDPANPYGAALPWPEHAGTRVGRAAGTSVVLVDGMLAAHVGKEARSVVMFAPADEPERSRVAEAAARALTGLLSPVRRTLLIGQVDGVPAQDSPWLPLFERAGFAATSQGLFARWSGGEG
ncbi:Lhr family helicase [Nannocystis punicea]|uniref:DEAD/DEAH box helicase n=1 Tax=Nannocystis punicea TaxID=2995304 RepID=A0ABY7GZH2_9BACT|nr:DEAD/DEAH box helicase [Nannocystis poenicansa]WAS92386.1 DEAD/DEAH box helicase [Nannocystis poenicansa]